MAAHPRTAEAIESPYAWMRLAVSLLLMTIGGSGMYSVTVVLPRIQSEFGVARGDASLPYTVTMIGFGLGGILMGRLADRFGVLVPVGLGAAGLGAGYIAAGLAPNLWLFCAAQGLLIGLLGTSATFAPLVADTSQWFDRRRGIALAICMSGNYTAGAIWPPVMQHFIDTVGWRQTYVGMGVFCVAAMVPLALVLRRRPPVHALAPTTAGARSQAGERPMGMSPGTVQALLCVAGVSCCVAMSMPQVHIVAYCGDLGFGAARGAEMLSLMLGLGVVSRLASGWISDRIGGLRTLLLGSGLQVVALLLFLPFKGLVSLYVVSGLFGPVPGWDRAFLRADRARAFLTARGRGPGRHGADGHAVRHGPGRVDVRRRVRPDRFLPRRFRQRDRLEPAEPRHRRFPAVPGESHDHRQDRDERDVTRAIVFR